MNDATLWNSGKTARQACYSVPFIQIQGIFLFKERFWSISISFIFFRAIMMYTVSEGAFFWDYSGIGILGIDGICVLLGAIPFSE